MLQQHPSFQGLTWPLLPRLLDLSLNDTPGTTLQQLISVQMEKKRKESR